MLFLTFSANYRLFSESNFDDLFLGNSNVEIVT